MAVMAQSIALYWDAHGLHDQAVKLMDRAREINDFSVDDQEVQLGAWEIDNQDQDEDEDDWAAMLEDADPEDDVDEMEPQAPPGETDNATSEIMSVILNY